MLILHFIFFLLRRAVMTELKNVKDAIMFLNEIYLLHVIMYGNKNFDINIGILTATTNFIKAFESFDQPLF